MKEVVVSGVRDCLSQPFAGTNGTFVNGKNSNIVRQMSAMWGDGDGALLQVALLVVWPAVLP